MSRLRAEVWEFEKTEKTCREKRKGEKQYVYMLAVMEYLELMINLVVKSEMRMPGRKDREKVS